MTYSVGKCMAHNMDTRESPLTNDVDYLVTGLPLILNQLRRDVTVVTNVDLPQISRGQVEVLEPLHRWKVGGGAGEGKNWFSYYM